MFIFAGKQRNMLPEDFLTRISHQDYIDAKGLTEALGQPSPVSVRINPYKWAHPISGYNKVLWEPQGYYLPGKPLFTPDPLFHAGVYYPQEASSMFTGEVFRQVTGGMENLRVLDLCGAPGGKSTHLSALISDRGFLVANEVIRSRVAVLAENITKWGLGNTVVTQNDPSAFASLPAFFDVIVADAPCSGEGMFRNPTAVQEWSPRNASLCSERQRRIVMETWPALKPGGILIYSTCTFNPAENEENIAWFRDSTASESVRIDIGGLSGVEPVCYAGTEGYGFQPDKVQGDGFFIAVLRKPNGNTDGHQRIKTGSQKPSAKIFNLAEQIMTVESDRLIMSGNRIIALATYRNVFSYIDDRLTVIKSGTMIGETKNDSFIPAHDLAMSVKQKQGAWQVYDATYDEAIAFIRLEQFRVEGMPRGRILIRYRGVPLGFVNNLGTRINNGYPQGWRMRMERQPDYREIL
jgi:16S rRNA C967 or C1407 C5-methylase (RsmB/RsmF family)/NOL1/NOP2/fmu family ribosome biogenesis protein